MLFPHTSLERSQKGVATALLTDMITASHSMDTATLLAHPYSYYRSSSLSYSCRCGRCGGGVDMIRKITEHGRDLPDDDC